VVRRDYSVVLLASPNSLGPVMRTIVIGDCHGHPHLISNALDHANYDFDRLIFAGDFLDIGSKPHECVTLLEENRADMLWGNHELAVVLGKRIVPQDGVSWSFRDYLLSGAFRVSAVQDGVLITHAGLSRFYCRACIGRSVQEISDILNAVSFEDLWDNDSPVWFRPNEKTVYQISQVAGHTPPCYMRPIEDFYLVDPYSDQEFGAGRYRYALIENGQVNVFSNDDVNGD
jgi:hypothetical protein